MSISGRNFNGFFVSRVLLPAATGPWHPGATAQPCCFKLSNKSNEALKTRLVNCSAALHVPPGRTFTSLAVTARRRYGARANNPILNAAKKPGAFLPSFRPQVDITGSDGETPLRKAAERGHSGVVATLFAAGAKVRWCCRSMRCVVAAHLCGAFNRCRSSDGRSGHVECNLHYKVTWMRQHLECIVLQCTCCSASLYVCTAQVDLADNHAYDILYRAAMRGDTAVVQALVAGGAKVDNNAKDYHSKVRRNAFCEV